MLRIFMVAAYTGAPQKTSPIATSSPSASAPSVRGYSSLEFNMLKGCFCNLLTFNGSAFIDC